jgi:hypothetical protein
MQVWGRLGIKARDVRIGQRFKAYSKPGKRFVQLKSFYCSMEEIQDSV